MSATPCESSHGAGRQGDLPTASGSRRARQTPYASPWPRDCRKAPHRRRWERARRTRHRYSRAATPVLSAPRSRDSPATPMSSPEYPLRATELAFIGWTASTRRCAPGRFHQPVRSDWKHSVPSGDHLAGESFAGRVPAGGPSRPSGPTSAVHSSVLSTACRDAARPATPDVSRQTEAGLE